MSKIFLAIVIYFFSCNVNAINLSAENTIKSCYRDYLKAYALPIAKGQSKMKKIRKRCLSENFLQQWNEIVSIEGSNADGLLLAQDYLDIWLTNISLKKMNPDVNSFQVLLGEGEQLRCLDVSYVVQGKTVKISAVKACIK